MIVKEWFETKFGSAPYKEVYNHFGLSEEKITGFIQKKLRE